MKHRKLRIAWSVAWGIVAVLLVALWVRSYWERDEISGCFSDKGGNIRTEPGMVQCLYISDPHLASTPQGWRYSNEPTEADTSFVSVLIGQFNYRRAPPMIYITLPDWLLVLTAAMASFSARFTWSNKFSLRTLLVATTVVAVGLGLIVWLA